MIIQSLILSLGLTVIFSEDPKIECRRDFQVGGCLYQNTIVLGYSFSDVDFALYHEIGHKMFLRDQEVKDLISKYPAPRVYTDKAYPTDNNKLNEKVADYFGMYIKYTDFPEKFPDIKAMFDSKIDKELGTLGRAKS